MSKINESLSDLLDDQCSSKDLDNLLNERGRLEDLYRYQTVSGILKGNYSVYASVDFCKDISNKIADEPAILAAPRPIPIQSANKSNKAEIRKIGTGFAIAASAAFATFFSVQTLQVSNDVLPINDNTAQIGQPRIENSSNTNAAENSIEQMELELFNDIFMQQARASEQDSIAPFSTQVGGQMVKTIRLSAEQWQELVRRVAKNKAEIEAAQSADPQKTDDLEDSMVGDSH